LNFAIHLQRSGDFDGGGFLDSDPAKIDSRTVEERLVSLPFGFRALSAAPGIGEARSFRSDQARALLERAGEIAEFVLVDLPARISPMHQAVVAASDFVAVLLEPDPLSGGRRTFGRRGLRGRL
jgi:Flp pilus assembly CpaE family ATPase